MGRSSIDGKDTIQRRFMNNLQSIRPTQARRIGARERPPSPPFSTDSSTTSSTRSSGARECQRAYLPSSYGGPDCSALSSPTTPQLSLLSMIGNFTCIVSESQGIQGQVGSLHPMRDQGHIKQGRGPPVVVGSQQDRRATVRPMYHLPQPRLTDHVSVRGASSHSPDAKKIVDTAAELLRTQKSLHSPVPWEELGPQEISGLVSRNSIWVEFTLDHPALWHGVKDLASTTQGARAIILAIANRKLSYPSFATLRTPLPAVCWASVRSGELAFDGCNLDPTKHGTWQALTAWYVPARPQGHDSRTSHCDKPERNGHSGIPDWEHVHPAVARAFALLLPNRGDTLDQYEANQGAPAARITAENLGNGVFRVASGVSGEEWLVNLRVHTARRITEESAAKPTTEWIENRGFPELTFRLHEWLLDPRTAALSVPQQEALALLLFADMDHPVESLGKTDPKVKADWIEAFRRDPGYESKFPGNATLARWAKEAAQNPR
jgi:hypothetical protein